MTAITDHGDPAALVLELGNLGTLVLGSDADEDEVDTEVGGDSM